MASEGMDIPKLNTIVLSSPKSDVVQAVGRILREKADVRKFHPLVIDIKDIHPNLAVFNKQSEKRIKYYKKSNHDIHLYKRDGSTEKIFGLESNYKKIKSIKILNMKENRVHQRCIAAGLKYIYEKENFDRVIVMDADGEDRPEDLNDFYKKS